MSPDTSTQAPSSDDEKEEFIPLIQKQNQSGLGGDGERREGGCGSNSARTYGVGPDDLDHCQHSSRRSQR